MIHTHFSSDPDDIFDISKLDTLTPDVLTAAPQTVTPSLPSLLHIQDHLTTRAPYPPPRLHKDLLIEVPDRPPRLHPEERLYHQQRKRLLLESEGRKVHMPNSKVDTKKSNWLDSLLIITMVPSNML